MFVITEFVITEFHCIIKNSFSLVRQICFVFIFTSLIVVRVDEDYRDICGYKMIGSELLSNLWRDVTCIHSPSSTFWILIEETFLLDDVITSEKCSDCVTFLCLRIMCGWDRRKSVWLCQCQLLVPSLEKVKTI